MSRFQRMITEDMVPSVGVLHRTIETEAAAIRTRMGTVNAGLRRAEFNEGTHLQIAWSTRPEPRFAPSCWTSIKRFAWGRAGDHDRELE